MVASQARKLLLSTRPTQELRTKCTRLDCLRPCAHESGSVRLRSQTGTDRPTVHTGSNLLTPVWLRYPYQPTDRIQKKVQIGNEADFVYKRPKHFLYFSSRLRGMSASKMYLSLIGSTWIRSRVHANYIGSDPVCTPEKFWMRSRKERSRTDPLSCAQGLRHRRKSCYICQKCFHAWEDPGT